MAEDQNDQQDDDQGTGSATDDTLGDGGKAALQAERKRAAAAEKAAKAFEARLREIEDRDKSEMQLAAERAEAAEKRAAELEHGVLRARVAAAKGVPESALTGDDEKSLNAAADALIAWRDAQSNGRRPAPVGGLHSGATGKTDGPTTGRERAAAALRELRGADR